MDLMKGRERWLRGADEGRTAITGAVASWGEVEASAVTSRVEGDHEALEAVTRAVPDAGQ